MDRIGLVELVTVYSDKLFATAYRRVGNKDIAKDIVQDTYLKILDPQFDLTKMKNPKSYIFSMVINRATDWQRYQQRFVDTEVEDSAVDSGSFEDLANVQTPLTDLRKSVSKLTLIKNSRSCSI